MDNNQHSYNKAQERVLEIKGFYSKLMSSVITVIILAGINYYLNAWSYPWFLWIVAIVVLATAVRAFKVFGINGVWGSQWEKRKIKELMQKEEDNQNSRWE
ncbi:2TM domain-containing protein [Sediminicola luteus]|uniref:2TM domain-containing protein n=1 Tax=Sediminicola luteus TaxID=319238 RepID=A0A2A4G8B1_9FLAO|nr:2TM domain-containing protein [Sediminicola luteus]PCE64661.1 hypothetical protein B7P33_05670 [Sediminicola luteus]